MQSFENFSDFFVFVCVPCSMSCKNHNGISCHNRQVSDEDNKYEDGKDRQNRDIADANLGHPLPPPTTSKVKFFLTSENLLHLLTNVTKNSL